MALDNDDPGGGLSTIPAVTPDVVKWLTAFTYNLVRAKVWRGVPGGEIPGGVQVADIVQTVFLKVWSGQRTWDRRHQEFRLALMDAVKTEVSNLSRRSENVRTRRLGGTGEAGAEESDNVYRLPSSADMADDIVARLEELRLLENILPEGDTLDRKVLRLILVEEIFDTAELAEAVGVGPTAIKNSKRRIKRKMEAFDPSFRRLTGRHGGAE